MRTNLAGKFRDYLQEFPNEPTTFLEALKKVQDLEEKSSEQDDLTARKRKGWLKLKGKDRQEKTDATLTKDGGAPADAKANGGGEASLPDGAGDQPASNNETLIAGDQQPETDKKQIDNVTNEDGATKKPSELVGEQLLSMGARHKKSEFTLPKLMPNINDKTKQSETIQQQRQQSIDGPEKPTKPTSGANKEKKHKDAKKLVKTKGENAVDFSVQGEQPKVQHDEKEKQAVVKEKVEPTSAEKQALNKPGRKRRDKPNLSRTKAAHLKPRGDSMENHNQLNLPPATSGHHHHHQQHPKTSSLQPKSEVAQSEATTSKDRTSGKTPRSRSKTKATTGKHSTVIQIEPIPGIEHPDRR